MSRRVVALSSAVVVVTAETMDLVTVATVGIVAANKILEALLFYVAVVVCNKNMHVWRKQTYIVWASVAIGLLLVLSIFFSSQKIRDWYQVASVRMYPNTERAFAYGEKHFDSASAGQYDLDLAYTFFRAAMAEDDKYPYVNHELARIEFLRGDNETAMLFINKEISLYGEKSPKSYYVRGLIEGYMGKYAAAAKDYRVYISHDPTNWAATNDLAWVLLKDNRPQEAVDAIDEILPLWPENPWLLNSKATALYELGRYKEASVAAELAAQTVLAINGKEWSKAYPGNDPLIGEAGAAAFQHAVFQNMHTISLALQKDAKDMR